MATIGIASFTPALGTTVEVAQAADEAGLSFTMTMERIRQNTLDLVDVGASIAD